MKYIFVAVFALSCTWAFSQDHTFYNKDKAISYAQTYNTDILMVFAGSDWCRPCIKFKKDILDNQQFIKESEQNLAVLYLDFPSKKKNKLPEDARKQNEDLAEKYNTSGSFPKIILMDSNFNKIKEISYEGQSVDAFIKELQ